MGSSPIPTTGRAGGEPDDSVPRADHTRDRTDTQGAIFRFDNRGEAAKQHMIPQPASDREPWVFCVPEDFGQKGGQPDPKLAGQPGHSAPPPSTAPSRDEAEASNVKRATVFQTRTPREAPEGRKPQSTAGGGQRAGTPLDG